MLKSKNGSKNHSPRNQTTLTDVYIDRITISAKFSCGKKAFKYLIGCKNYRIVNPLCIIPPKMSGYVRSFDNAKWMSLLIKRPTIAKKIQ